MATIWFHIVLSHRQVHITDSTETTVSAEITADMVAVLHMENGEEVHSGHQVHLIPLQRYRQVHTAVLVATVDITVVMPQAMPTAIICGLQAQQAMVQLPITVTETELFYTLIITANGVIGLNGAQHQ